MRSQTPKQVQRGKGERAEKREGAGVGQSHRLAFWRRGQHPGGRICKYFQGFVTSHKKRRVHAHSQRLSAHPLLPRAGGSISAFCPEMWR